MKNKNNTCLVSFIYPNKIDHLNYFVNKLKEQTDQKFDFVLFINNSKKKIQNKYIKKKIYLNYPIVKSRFVMIQKIKKLDYKNIIFLDIDDTMSKRRIEISKKMLKLNSLVVNDIIIRSGKRKLVNYISRRIKNKTLINFELIKNKNFIGMSNSAIKNSLIKNIKFTYNKNILIFDWFFWSYIMQRKKIKASFTNKFHTYYNVREKSITRLPSIMSKKNIKKIKRIIKNHFKVLKLNIKIKNLVTTNNLWWEFNEK